MESPPSVAVIGAGYVGLTAAACLAHLGRRVVAVDIDRARIRRLRGGDLPLYEPGLGALVTGGLASGRLHFADSHAAGATADVVLLCLPTPSAADGCPDLSFVEAALDELRPLVRPGAVVATKSTVPVGSSRHLAAHLDRSDVSLATNPEFLREGSAVQDFLHPDRIVIGVDDAAAGQALSAVYRGIDAPIQVTDPTSAELIKYAANAFLAAKVSFVNEISRLADAYRAEIGGVVRGVAADARIGPAFLEPGPGWGGSCFPKDTLGLAAVARAAGVDVPVVAAAHRSNEIQLDHVADRIDTVLGGRPGRLAVWGVTFKAGTDDVRDSPAGWIVDRLVAAGHQVVAYDPMADPHQVGVPLVDDPYTACVGADALAVLTEWPEFATADLGKVVDVLDRPVIYDTRGVIDELAADRAGAVLHRLGRPTIDGRRAG